MDGLFNIKKLNKNEVKDYEYFKDPLIRKDIYEFSKGIASYLNEKNIPNIILLDKSARPFWVGIDEYWNIHYKDKIKPNIYFINPDAFDVIKSAITNLNYSEEDILKDGFIFSITGNSEIINNANKNTENIKKQFEEAYKKLNKEKGKALAVYDNCIHSGSTIIPVISLLSKFGYSDLRVIIGETSSDYSSVRIDKEFTDKVKYKACGIFIDNFGVREDFKSIVSKLDKEANRDLVYKSRKEIRKIIREEKD